MKIASLSLDKPRIMGILNITPDSFSDGGKFFNFQSAIDHALQLEDEGADIIDIGGESTRPGSEPVALEDELERVIPVIQSLSERVSAKLSIDTRKTKVMREAIANGCHIINDVSALTYDKQSLNFVSQNNIPVILMHAKGDPKTMQNAPQYENVIEEIYQYLQSRISACLEAGLEKDNIIIDPGIGFGKTLQHNLSILKKLQHFHKLEVPILIGASRKRFIGEISGVNQPEDRLPGSLATALWAFEQGAKIFRVHDIAETKQAMDIWQSFKE